MRRVWLRVRHADRSVREWWHWNVTCQIFGHKYHPRMHGYVCTRCNNWSHLPLDREPRV